MPIQQLNVDNFKQQYNYIYDTLMFIANKATGLPCYIERTNFNRPTQTYCSMFLETLNPLGYYTDANIIVPDGETTEHRQQVIHYQPTVTVRTWKTDANAYAAAIQAAFKDRSASEFMSDRCIGWMSESSILNATTILDEAYEERASFVVQLNCYLGVIDPDEFQYINHVTGTQTVLTAPPTPDPITPPAVLPTVEFDILVDP